MSATIKSWEAPGFKFYTDEMRAWLGDYRPTAADQVVAEARKPPTPSTWMAEHENREASKDRLRVAKRHAGEMQVKPR